jgi:hypothetical protein
VADRAEDESLEQAMEQIRAFIGSLKPDEIDTLLSNLNDRLADLRATASRHGVSGSPGAESD